MSLGGLPAPLYYFGMPIHFRVSRSKHILEGMRRYKVPAWRPVQVNLRYKVHLVCTVVYFRVFQCFKTLRNPKTLSASYFAKYMFGIRLVYLSQSLKYTEVQSTTTLCCSALAEVQSTGQYCRNLQEYHFLMWPRWVMCMYPMPSISPEPHPTELHAC